jgi:hypothetical protein
MKPHRPTHLHIVRGGTSHRRSPPAATPLDADAKRNRGPIERAPDSADHACGQRAEEGASRRRDDAIRSLGIVEATERTDEVMTFIAGHVAAQSLAGSAHGLPLADWIARLGESLGQASALAVRDPADEAAARAMSGWLACAAADGLLAGVDLSVRWLPEPDEDLDRRLGDMGAALVSASLLSARWNATTELAYVYRELGELCDAATPLMAADPAAFRGRATLGDLLLEAIRDEPATPEADPQDATDSSVEDVLGALEEFALRSGEAAVLLHPGGTVSMNP